MKVKIIVAKFRYLEIIITDLNYVHEDINNRLKECFTVFSSGLDFMSSENIMFKIICNFACYFGFLRDRTNKRMGKMS